MRLIIDNDKYQLYARTDYALSETTLTSSAVSAGATVLSVVNANGFATDDYVVVEDIGNERSEIRKITVSANNFTIDALTFEHSIKTKVSRLQYNQVKFYEDTTLLDTIDINPDYFTKYATAIDTEKTYYITYYNSTATLTSPKGEVLNGYEYNLCSVGDVIQYENASILGNKLLDKIDIASREIRSNFISQEQEFTDLSSRDIARLREPVALRALYYIFVELIKNPDDVPSQKAKLYSSLYDTKLTEVMSVISKENDDVNIWGQTRSIR